MDSTSGSSGSFPPNVSSSSIICPRPYTTATDSGAIPCGITYAQAIGWNQYLVARGIMLGLCIPLVIIVLIQVIRLIYYRGFSDVMKIHAIYLFVSLSSISQLIRAVDPQNWAGVINMTLFQFLGDMSTCWILSIIFILAISWFQLMRQLRGKAPSQFVRVAEWVMPIVFHMFVITLSFLQSTVHTPGTYLYVTIKTIVFIVYIFSFVAITWTQGIPLFKTLNTPIPSPNHSRVLTSQSSAARVAPRSPSPNVAGARSSIAVPIPHDEPHASNMDIMMTPYRANGLETETLEMEPSITTTTTTGRISSEVRALMTPKENPRLLKRMNTPSTTILQAQIDAELQNSCDPTTTMNTSPLSGTRTSTLAINIPAPVTVTVTASSTPAPAPSNNTQTKLTRILKLMVVMTLASSVAIGLYIWRMAGDYASKYDDVYRPKAVPTSIANVGLLLAIVEWIACMIALFFFRQIKSGHSRGDKSNTGTGTATATGTGTAHASGPNNNNNNNNTDKVLNTLNTQPLDTQI